MALDRVIVNMADFNTAFSFVNDGNIEMFCMSEMYDGTITSQYAHDKRTGKL